MLWLAGLMGLMAAGAAILVDFGSDEEGDDMLENEIAADGQQGGSLPAPAAETASSTGNAPDEAVALAASTDADASLSTTITDYKPADDALLCIWDDSGDQDAPPEVTLQDDPDTPGQLLVRLGSEVIAQVSGDSDLSSADISLMPLSSAIALELVSA